MGSALSRPALRRGTVAAAVLAGLIISGCSGGNPVFKPTITQQHANVRAEQILRETTAAITPQPALETDQLESGTGPCLVNPSDSSDKRVQVVLSYWLRGISTQDNASVGQQILRYWRHKGYGISGTKGIGTDSPAIFAVTPDNFLISLETSGNGALSIGTSSPCLWPKGTPPPS